MLTLLAFSTLIILGSALIGFTVAPFLISKIAPDQSNRGPITLAVAVCTGFAFSALAATWSFGATGANNYLYFLIAFFVISLLLLALKPLRNGLKLWREFSLKDLFLVVIPVLVAFFSKPYWVNMKDMRITAGVGPDIPQNLMTVLSQPKVGSTWFAGRDQFLHFVNSSNLNEAVYHLYQLPSMQQQAGVDYLIYGTRWGLSIPFAQLLRIDPRYLVMGQGLSICIGLIALALVIYAFCKIINLRPTISVMLTLASVSSSGFLYQAYNGGMAQAWGLPGLALLSLGFFLAIYFAADHQLTKNKQLALVGMMSIGWLANAVTYIDSTMILVGAFALTAIFLYFVAEHAVASKALLITFGGGLIAAILVSPYCYAVLQTLRLRLRLAAGTGLVFNHWPLPSEILGIFNIWTQNDGKPRDGGLMLVGVLLTLGIIWIALKGLVLKNKVDRTLSYLALSVFLICGGVALWAKHTSLGSNYSYVKVSTYLSPLLLMIIGYKLTSAKQLVSKAKRSTLSLSASYITPVSYILLIVLSTFSTNNGMIKNASYLVSKAQMEIFADPKAQAELNDYNYLTTYTAVANILGFLGDTHWVAKAPNDQLLGTRMNVEMRLICFAADQACKPKTPQITSSILPKYGLLVYKSPIDTKTFASLKPLDRYYAAMDAVGQPRLKIPDRFIGGNPLLK